MKKLPSNIEAETYIIGCMLYDNTCIEKAKELLKPEHFLSTTNRLFCKTIYDLNNSGIAVDSISLYEALKDEANPAVFIKLVNDISSVANIDYSLRVVYEKFMRRNLITIANNILKETEDESKDIFELIAESTNNLNSVTDNIPSGDLTLYDRLPDVIQQVKDRMIRKDINSLESVYFPSFNKLTGGVLPGEYLSLSGKDKRGKSTWAYKLLLDFAINSKMPVGVFSYEMCEKILDWKAISLETGIPFNKLRNPHGYYQDTNSKLTDKELENVAVLSNRKFKNTKIYTCDRVLNEQQVKSKMKKWIKEYGVKFFLIDYIGLMPTMERFAPSEREKQISYISRFFKQTTQDLRINTLILSQQNRDGDIAESMALQRDPDFAFTIEKPFDDDILSVKIGDQSFKMTEDDYVVTLKRNRMGQQKKQFIVGYTSENQFCELDKTRGEHEPISKHNDPQDNNFTLGLD